MTTDIGLPESNWQPTRTATLIAVTVTVVATLGLTAAIGALTQAVVGLLAGGCLAAAVWTTAVTERRVAALAGSGLAAASGLLSVGALLLAVVSQTAWPPVPPIPFLEIAPFAAAIAATVAGFGVLAALWGVTPADHAGVAGQRLFVAALVPLAALAVSLEAVPRDVLRAGVSTAIDLLLARGPAATPELLLPQLGGVLFLAAVAAVALRVALGQLPLGELASAAIVDTVEAIVGRVRFGLATVALLAFVLGMIPLAAGPTAEGLLAALPGWVGQAALSLAASTPVRTALVGVLLVSCGVVIGVRAIRAAASAEFRPESMPLATPAAGLLLVVCVWLAHPAVQSLAVDSAATDEGRRFLLEVFETFGSLSVTLAVVAVGILGATLSLLGIRLAGTLRLLGDIAGIQFAASGVLIAAIAAAIGGASPLVVVGGVAACLLVWDLGEFGATLGTEMGRLGKTRRGELVHVAGGAILAGLTVAATAGVLSILQSLPVADTSAVFVTATAAIGAVLLVVVLR